MSEVRINKMPWQLLAEKLFFDDFEDPRAFYETFGEPSAVYHELTRRIMARTVIVSVTRNVGELGVLNADFLREAQTATDQVIESAAYKIMCDAFNKDAETGGREQLAMLAKTYEALI